MCVSACECVYMCARTRTHAHWSGDVIEHSEVNLRYILSTMFPLVLSLVHGKVLSPPERIVDKFLDV